MRDTGATRQWSDAAVLTVLITMLALTGCVTKESYTQQVNRTTNLQRLLAEEEKRSSDLVNDVARLKSQVNDLEAQNKVISDQLKESRAQVVRSLEEVGRLQEEGQSRRPGVKSKRQAVAPAPTSSHLRRLSAFCRVLSFLLSRSNKWPSNPSRSFTRRSSASRSGPSICRLVTPYKSTIAEFTQALERRIAA